MLSKFNKKLFSFSNELRIKVLSTQHFYERLSQRFEEDDVENLNKCLVKAFEKAASGEKIKYTHSYYKMTVVIKKIGVNGMELITAWKKDEDAECC